MHRGGTLYIQGDLGAVKVTASEDGGTYLGSSVHYPGDIASVDVQLSGSGGLIVATSSSESPLSHLLAGPPVQQVFPIHLLHQTSDMQTQDYRQRLTLARMVESFASP